MNPHDINTPEEAKAAGWTFYGPEEDQMSKYTWHRVQKAVFEDGDCRIVMVTRRMLVEGGTLWQTHTQTSTFGLPQDSPFDPSQKMLPITGVRTSESLTFQPTSA